MSFRSGPGLLVDSTNPWRASCSFWNWGPRPQLSTFRPEIARFCLWTFKIFSGEGPNPEHPVGFPMQTFATHQSWDGALALQNPGSAAEHLHNISEFIRPKAHKHGGPRLEMIDLPRCFHVDWMNFYRNTKIQGLPRPAQRMSNHINFLKTLLDLCMFGNPCIPVFSAKPKSTLEKVFSSSVFILGLTIPVLSDGTIKVAILEKEKKAKIVFIFYIKINVLVYIPKLNCVRNHY